MAQKITINLFCCDIKYFCYIRDNNQVNYIFKASIFYKVDTYIIREFSQHVKPLSTQGNQRLIIDILSFCYKIISMSKYFTS
jgi:hypothetical protein